MRITVIGCGYLGAVHAASMAELGHDVVGIDIDEAKIAMLASGRAPFYEPGLPELLERSLAGGRLRFTTDMSAARGNRIHFVAVGTPQKPRENAADLRFVDAAIDALVPWLEAGDLVVGKSTVPVGTARGIADRLAESETGASLAWNPEFLREGLAVKDTLHPDRLVYGVPDGDPAGARQLLDEVYAATLSEGTPLVVTDYETAELVKVSANAFLATKISFINAMAEVCEVVGADVTQLADAIGYDARIGRRFLNAGLGFGGGCLPKDIRAFMARAGELGADQALTFLREVDRINMRRRERAVDLVREVLDGSLLGRRIAVLGLAFKPDSDDVRDSPALNVAAMLSLQGAAVICHDPKAVPNSRKRFPELSYTESLDEAVADADVVLVLTEWGDYLEIDPEVLARKVANPIVVDGRNCLDAEAWRAAGWRYRALGRRRMDARVGALV
ncbi:UDP-glucose dehydrogenase family protein [Lysinimonas soli]|uniref:UDP-glucose 6-dehydrogenase n=1 Tax=Lysinimonas soli TaxID=1074233 RepID=A0ABW0NS44_9MICO